MYEYESGIKFKIYYRFYSFAMKSGLIVMDTWEEDEGDGMKHIVIEPRWFWQKRGN